MTPSTGDPLAYMSASRVQSTETWLVTSITGFFLYTHTASYITDKDPPIATQPSVGCMVYGLNNRINK